MPAIRCDVEALLIVELDGPAAEVDHLIARVEEIATTCGAVSCRISQTEEERLHFWAGRKAAFPAVGRISPDYYCMDGTIPRGRLPEVLTRMSELSKQLRAARRQCLPCRRRQSASADPLRRQQAGRAGARRGLRRRHPAALRRGRRRADRRAWRRRREARPDAGDVQRDRPGAAAAREMRLRSRRPAQSRQGLPRAASLRRAGPAACPSAASCRIPTCRGSDAAGERRAPCTLTSSLRTSTRSSTPCAGRWRSSSRWRSSGGAASAGWAGRSQAGAALDLSDLSGIVSYEPEELVLTAGAGTPLAEIEAALAAKHQHARLRAADLAAALRRGRRGRGRSAACSPAISRARGASRRARRAIISWASPPSTAAARSSRPAAGGEERHRLRPAASCWLRLLRHAGGR